ncbi:MAG: TerC family protein [Bryobacteraceae bacterium]
MPDLSLRFLFDALQIVLIDLVLAGDNAVVIAMAVRSLPVSQRRMGILLGAGLAVILRIAITFFASQLLQVQFVKLLGGLAVLWIAVKMLAQPGEQEEGREARGLWQAMWMILVADITMSIDNILAVAGASKGNLFLLIFGLTVSIPFVIFTSRLLSTLMDRYPIIVWIGAAILGRVAGEMIFSDPWVTSQIALPHWTVWVAEVVFAGGVVGAGWLLQRQRRAGT